MPVFQPNQPIAQNEPDVLVEAQASELGVGAHRFRLVVVDSAGNESQPAFVEIIVQDQDRPTAVLDVRDAEGRRIEPVVGFGDDFILSGRRSFDPAPGSVGEYRFTLVREDG